MPCDLNAYDLARNEHRRRSRQSFFTVALLHSHLGCIHMVKVHGRAVRWKCTRNVLMSAVLAIHVSAF